MTPSSSSRNNDLAAPLTALALEQTRVEFTPFDHSYRIDGKPAISVTTVTGALDKPDLLGWAARIQRSTDLSKLRRLPPVAGESHRDYVARLEDSLGEPRAHSDVATSAAGRGTRIHKAFEAWALNELGLPSREFVPQSDFEATAVERLILAMKTFDVQPVASEAFVVPMPGVGGAFDLLAWVRGRLTLVDLKTGKLVRRVYSNHRLQTAAYAGALLDLGFPIEARLVVSSCRDTGEVLLKPVDGDIREDFEIFQHLVPVARWANRKEAA